MMFSRAVLAASISVLAATAHSHDPSFQECLEGSEFILHAAMSRDNGMARSEFIGRVHADLLAIQGFPLEYRWFAKDEDDERFLVEHSEAVFDNPQPPQGHQSSFLEACVARMSTEATQLEPLPEATPTLDGRDDKASRL